MKTQLITLTLIILSSLTVQAQDTVKTFGTITEALNYDGDRSEIKHLIITDSISGVGYEIGSEWREFRSLNLAYPALEEVTVYTDQDIPNSGWDGSNLNGQFMGSSPFGGAHWIKKFNGNNIKRIGTDAFLGCIYLTDISFNSVEVIGNASFYNCYGLTVVDLPSAIILESYAFAYCTTLVSINTPLVTTVGSSCFNYNRYLKEIDLPLVTMLGHKAFYACLRLTSVSFGGGFETETEIVFDAYVFDDSKGPLTKNINLFLSPFVFPKPDTNASTWQTLWSNGNGPSYVWKMIKTVGIEEYEEKIVLLYLGNNTYYVDSDDVLEFELFDLLGNQIQKYNGVRIIDINHIPTGIYFIQSSNRKRIKFEKLIRY